MSLRCAARARLSLLPRRSPSLHLTPSPSSAQDWVTFGAYIDDAPVANLWMYAYLPNGSLWYVSKPAPNDGQALRDALTPYIGVWTDSSGAPSYVCLDSVPTFETGYRNFVYQPPSFFPAGANPSKDPHLFGPALTGGRVTGPWVGSRPSSIPPSRRPADGAAPPPVREEVGVALVGACLLATVVASAWWGVRR